MSEIICEEETCRWNEEITSAIDRKPVRLCRKDFISMDRWGCVDYEEVSPTNPKGGKEG